MNSAMCSSSSSFMIASSCCQNLQSRKHFILAPAPFERIGDSHMIDALQKYNRKERKVLISSHLVPGHLDALGTRIFFLHEPVPKLEFVRTLLIDNYDSYTYNIFQELSIINGSKFSISYNVSFPMLTFSNHLNIYSLKCGTMSIPYAFSVLCI